MTNLDRNAFLEAVARVCAETIEPAATVIDSEREFPHANVKALAEAGFFKLTIPESEGGLGCGIGGDFRTMFEVIMTVASSCVSTAQVVGVHLVADCILGLLGTDEQQKRFWDVQRSQGLLWAMWASEPGKGAIRVNLETKATKVEGGYVINGKKHYATNSLGADWIQLYVQRESMSLADGMILAAVPTSDPGVTIVDDWDAMGQRGTASGTALFEEVFVPDANVLASEAEFFRPQIIGSVFQSMFSAIYVGAAEGALKAAKVYLRDKARPTANYARRVDDPVLQHQLGLYESRVFAARMATLEAVSSLGDVVRGEQAYVEASLRAAMAGVVAAGSATEVVNEVFRLTGSGAARRVDGRALALEVFLRNVRLLSLQSSVDDKCVLVGQAALGVNQPNPTLST